MKRIWVFLIALLPAFYCFAQSSNIVVLTSLEWPPYTGKQLANCGASSVVVAAAFKAMGYELRIEYFPWARTVALAKGQDPRYSGYFPEYYSAENSRNFIYSASIGSGPLGFVERKDDPIKWETLDDLKGMNIGVVNGYINTDNFDALVASGEIHVNPVADDATNLRLVAGRRIRLAVIDRNVLYYLLRNMAFDSLSADVVQFNPHPLEDRNLYVCFRKGAEGDRLVRIFNEGLERIDAEKIMQDYLSAD